jgi:hypothetical protein
MDLTGDSGHYGLDMKHPPQKAHVLKSGGQLMGFWNLIGSQGL